MKKTNLKKITTFAATAAGAAIIAAGSLGAAAPVMAAPAAYISQTAAKTAALNHAKVTASKISNFEIELDKERTGVYYEIEFDANGYEYDYKINAKNATVVKSEKKVIRTKNNSKNITTTAAKATTQTKVNYISKDKAKTIALAHAKVASNKITGYKIEFDKERNVSYYDIEFTANGYKYEYDVNAVTGKIIKSEKKAVRRVNQSKTVTKTTPVSAVKTNYIGEAKAKAIALAHAKVAANRAYSMKCKLDREKGVYVYEVEFKSGRYEYEYDINATTGKIIKCDKDFD